MYLTLIVKDLANLTVTYWRMFQLYGQRQPQDISPLYRRLYLTVRMLMPERKLILPHCAQRALMVTHISYPTCWKKGLIPKSQTVMVTHVLWSRVTSQCYTCLRSLITHSFLGATKNVLIFCCNKRAWILIGGQIKEPPLCTMLPNLTMSAFLKSCCQRVHDFLKMNWTCHHF